MSSVDISRTWRSEPASRRQAQGEADDRGCRTKAARDGVRRAPGQGPRSSARHRASRSPSPRRWSVRRRGCFLVAIWAIAADPGRRPTPPGARCPAKYLVPGTLMLVLFVVYPIVLTAQTSFTNYGDGTRNTKEETVTQIVGSLGRADGGRAAATT